MKARSITAESRIVIALAVVLTVLAGYIHVQMWFPHDNRKEDIYYSWQEGQRLLLGVNPYERILEGDMLAIKKCPTYLPLFYLLSGLSEKMGWREYGDYLRFWRPIFLAAMIATGLAMFGAILLRGSPVLALLSLALWYFGRWTLYVTVVTNFDFLPISLVVLSLAVWKRCPWGAALLFGISLGLKQIAVFVAPLYLIWAWRETPGLSNRRRLTVVLALVAVPLLLSIPFLLWNAEGYIKSIAYSGLREDYGAFPFASSIDYIMRWEGAFSRLPLLLVLLAVYAGAAMRRLTPWRAACLAMLAFVAFNRTLFYQYLCWTVPLTMLALAETNEGNDTCDAQIALPEAAP
jgi:hypothetical protein